MHYPFLCSCLLTLRCSWSSFSIRCVVNANCASSQYCNHDSGNGQVFTCVWPCERLPVGWGCVNNGAPCGQRKRGGDLPIF